MPGVHVNISKSGISTNIGVKGASVTFSQNGTYVNTGIPGTGLYRRDKITDSGKSTRMDGVSSIANTIVAPDFTQPETKEERIGMFFAYVIAMLMPFVGWVLYVESGWWMFFCCLLTDFIQLLCWGTVLSSRTFGTKRNSIGHIIGCICSFVLVFLNMYPFFAMNKDFVALYNSMVGDYSYFVHSYEGGLSVSALTVIIAFLWLINAICEFQQAKENRRSFCGSKTNEETGTEKRKDFEGEEETVSKELEQLKVPVSSTEDVDKKESTSQMVNDTIEIKKKVVDTVSPTNAVLEVSDKGWREQGMQKGTNNDEMSVPYDPKLDLEYYKYPTLELLKKSEEKSSPQMDVLGLEDNKNRVVEVLHQFGVEIRNIKATVGPTITLYEIVLAEGFNMSKMRGLEDNIALALGSRNVRIVPLAHSGTVGIEALNMKPSVVSFESLINSRIYQESKMELPCVIGKTQTNEVFLFDLTKAPHVLIAGSTGQGKSMALHAIIMSLLYKKHPTELKFILMDSRGLELGLYAPIENHFLAIIPDRHPVVMNNSHAIDILRCLNIEVNRRYELLIDAGVRDVKDYNEKFKNRLLNPEKGHEYLPYIVVVIDSYSDFSIGREEEMMQSLFQLIKGARAVGVHVIIATERPSSDILSSEIKSLIPTRIAFRTAERIDSQVILDMDGAEKLLGTGDSLFKSKYSFERIQCAFLDTYEIRDTCSYIAKQQSFLHPMFLPEIADVERYTDMELTPLEKGHLDPMFADVAKFVVSNQSGSTSMIQRNYSIGYNRAGKIMDQLERMGIVGPQVGAEPREVLIKDPLILEGLLNSL